MKGSHSARVREWIRKGSAHVFQLGSQTQLSRHLSPSFLEFTSFKLEGQSPGTCIFNRRKWSFVVGGEFWYNTVSGTWPATITDQDHLGTPVEPGTTGTF